MPEADDQVSDNGKVINWDCAGKDNGKPLLLFDQENHWDTKYKMIDDIVPDDRPLRLDGTQMEEKLRTFQSTIGIYEVARLKSLVADVG